jgi:hypothetical protein
MAKPDQTSALERDMEEIRVRLAGTIDELMYRASPKTIANRQIAAVKATYVDPETGEPNMRSIAITAGGVAGFVALIVVLRTLSKR